MDGIFASLPPSLSPIANYYNRPGEPEVYNPGFVALLAICFVVTGLVFSMVVAGIVSKYKVFLLALRIICILVTLNLIGLTFTCPSLNRPLLACNIAFFGGSMTPILPVCLSFGCELTFPIDPNLTNGFLLLFSNTTGSILGVYGTELAQIDP